MVLFAGAPDTPEIAAEMKAAVEAARRSYEHIVWIEEMVDTETKIAAYTHAWLFCCPSIYEPFGIINLEAMACDTPVVASEVGGMKEVVVHGETGLLVPVKRGNESSPFEPTNPEQFSYDLATAINDLMGDHHRRMGMSRAGRQRAVEHYSWATIAERVADLYRRLVEGKESENQP